jgi:hypothetical protein
MPASAPDRARPLGVASWVSLRYLPRSRAPSAWESPFLLGNGVMVTQRFLVPSF